MTSHRPEAAPASPGPAEETGSGTELGTRSDPEPRPEAETRPEAEPGWMEAGPEPGPSEPQPEPDPEPDAEPGWTEAEDDRTAETLAWLRRKRRAHRRRQGRDLAVVLYTVTLGVVAYGSSLALHFLRGLGEGADYGGFGAGLARSLPSLIPAVAVLLGLLSARDALWRGPVVLPAPQVGWLLTQPVRRAAVLRPWFRLSAGLALVPAVLGGVAAGVALRVTGQASIGAALLGVAPGAVCLPLLSVALGMAVERRPHRTATVRRWTGPVVVLLAGLAAQAALAGAGHRVRALEWAELWSGPWGWAAQPVVRACGGGVPGWPVALALLPAATAAAVWRAHREAAEVPTAHLRARAATAATVASVFWSLELRAAKLALLEAAGDQSTRRVRLRPPRGRVGRRFVVVWRDLLTLLCAPGRLGRAVVWAAAGAVLAGVGADLAGERRPVGLVLGLLCGYLAVGALAEPARVETDDLRRSAWAPYRFRTLMLWHGVLPAVLGAVLGLLAAVPFAVHGSPVALLLVPLCAPPFAAAALYSACRGPARTHLMFLGGGSPMGGPGPLIYLAWYAAGPLAAVGCLAPALSLAGPAGVVVLDLAVTAALSALAARSAAALVRH